ncbi:MAG: UDP-N-acetylmuramoyl-L-alanyl-D-glutamate--2,6-diaminopimelate ligase [Bacteroidales bacterium]|nr:UDP-N-acetylmuramoyl-L-alanyl-D-glutamate--2,6-diaminopimelate ligase [Bacteroidales bacterium]
MPYLKEILKNIEVEQCIGDINISVNNICFDSREADNNFLFIAVRGINVDGHNYIDKAIEKGINSVVCEELPLKINNKITYIKVKDSKFSLGQIASNYYGNPSSKLKLIGITGTNGKTTISTLLFQLFKNLAYKTGLFSTVRNYINDKEIIATHTTPDAIQLNSLLKAMVDEGCQYCFMEVSSHAIDQDRISGLKFSGGVFTNITHDHLDYHETFDKYLKAKKRFFDSLLVDSFVLSNTDDKNGKIMTQNTKAKKYTYGIKAFADFKAKILESHFDGTLLTIDGLELWTKFIGDFNASNLLAVYAVAILLGQEREKILSTISNLNTVEGRFESIRSSNGIIVIVDYAHTPDALKNVINTINKIRGEKGQLITVVGAGGDRDKAKRPMMGKIVSELSDKIIFTSDNPRNEDPLSIIEEIKSGVNSKKEGKILTIENRREAIKTAYMIANMGDIILIAGKGHETYQEIKGVRYDFDDKKIIKDLMKIE